MKKIIVRAFLLFSVCILLIYSAAMIIVADSTNKTAAKDNAVEFLNVFEIQIKDGDYTALEN